MAQRSKDTVEDIGGQKTKGPKYPFYRDKNNGGIYPAMSSPPGHEDKNPDDWEPCTPEEIKAEQDKLLVIREQKKAALRAQSAAADTAPAEPAAPAAPPAAPSGVLSKGPVLPGS